MRKFTTILTFIFFQFTVINAQNPLVQTAFGPIEGLQNDETLEFLGIPFASPPIGDLRWRPPVAPEPWTTPLLTQAFSPKCPQKNFSQGDTTSVVEGNEDCLYLNIWTPDTTGSNLPVMVFIHGGGNQQGSASEFTLGTEIYNGKNLSQRGNVVVVTIQYRLGPLGFLVHPGLEVENGENTSGNYAVMDQILALEWVQQNIAAFGGDNSRVMIFGESAGGVNVGNLLTTPMASGLFQRACIQSAGPNLQNYSDALDNGMAFADSLNATGTDIEEIAYLRSVDAETLISGLESPLNGGFVRSKWKPVLDNYLFEDTPINTIQTGEFNQVPLIIGSNADEMSLSAPAVVTEAMVNALINLFIPYNFRPLAHDLYEDEGTFRDIYVQLLTDAQFTAPSRRTARCISQNQDAPVYRYFFTYAHSGVVGSYGAYHGIELIYLFNNFENSIMGGTPLHTIQDDSVEMNLLNYWVNFAYTGNPNGNDLELWPEYGSSSDCYLEIKASPVGNQCGLRTLKSNLWDDAVGFTGCSTSVSTENVDYLQEQWDIYPNPTYGPLTLEAEELPDFFELNILDATGKKLAGYFNENQIDLTSYPSGVYFIIIKTQKGIDIEKVFKW
ncbi:MAG: T9SS C-terminal target domain-containing protein [Bacteroidetes bacterium]|nr:MAG: T9SS C-terminal target domain-containing protein [Bacteroidota bacterium]